MKINMEQFTIKPLKWEQWGNLEVYEANSVKIYYIVEKDLTSEKYKLFWETENGQGVLYEGTIEECKARAEAEHTNEVKEWLIAG